MRQFQLVILALYVITVIPLVILMFTRVKLFIIAPLIYIIHGVVFYTYVIVTNPVPGNSIATSWSIVLRLHEAITILGYAIIISMYFYLVRRGRHADVI